MTVASHELALWIIDGTGPRAHDGSTYEERYELASTWPSAYDSFVAPPQWVRIATLGARAYHAEFGGTDCWWNIFDSEDILACATELAAYYREHVKEVAAA